MRPEDHPDVGLIVSVHIGDGRVLPGRIEAQDDRGLVDLVVDLGRGSFVVHKGTRLIHESAPHEGATCWFPPSYQVRLWRRAGYGVIDAAGSRTAT